MYTRPPCGVTTDTTGFRLRFTVSVGVSRVQQNWFTVRLGFEILTASRMSRVKMRNCGKFRGSRSNRCRNIAIINFSIWRPRVFTIHEEHLVVFNVVQNLMIIRIFRFCEFGQKMSIHAYQRTTKSTSLPRKDVMTYISSKSVHRCQWRTNVYRHSRHVPRVGARDTQGARTRGVLDGLGVKGHSRSFDTIPFDRSHTIS